MYLLVFVNNDVRHGDLSHISPVQNWGEIGEVFGVAVQLLVSMYCFKRERRNAHRDVAWVWFRRLGCGWVMG